MLGQYQLLIVVDGARIPDQGQAQSSHSIPQQGEFGTGGEGVNVLNFGRKISCFLLVRCLLLFFGGKEMYTFCVWI